MKKLILTSLFLFAQNIFANPESVYSSLDTKDCITIDSSELLPLDEQEIDYYEGECASFGGYQIGVVGGDIRYSVTLKYNKVEIDLPQLSAFHNPGNLAEWRFERNTSANNKKSLEYKSLIYRLNFDDYNAETEEPFTNTMLVVVKLDKENSCVTGIVNNKKNMNIEARKIADDLNAKCVSF